MDKSHSTKLDKIMADVRRVNDERNQGYREQALKLYPHICGQCGREFDRNNLHELTVHHRDHDHNNNPSDGSNWELLCLYCHDNEHQRHQVSATPQDNVSQTKIATYKPFADLKSLLNKKQ